MKEYPGRGVLGFSLMASQAVLYNATLFGMVSILTTFFHASKANAPLYIIPFAIGNLLGPWLLGPLFDTVGRKVMISSTYLLAGAILLVTAYLFHQQRPVGDDADDLLGVCFFFASAGASAAYLTVSEIFPMETRAMAIALFYACGTGVAIAAPWTFGKLIETGSYGNVTIAFVIGGVIMAIGGIVEILLGVDAERKSLEAVARPINAVRRKASAPAVALARARLVRLVQTRPVPGTVTKPQRNRHRARRLSHRLARDHRRRRCLRTPACAIRQSARAVRPERARPARSMKASVRFQASSEASANCSCLRSKKLCGAPS